jgi:ELWxxDGT repeat protein
MLFFKANDGIHGYELWKSDGTEMGTVLVKDIVSWLGSSDPQNFVNVDGTLYFTAYDGVHGQELWRSDGTEAGTELVKDINPGAESSQPWSLTGVNGSLFFAAFDPDNGRELWKSDGTQDGTVLVKDIFPGSMWSSPWNLTNVNGVLYFSADDGIHGWELWKSDGSTAGTLLVRDVVPGSGSSFSLSSNLRAVNGTLLFWAADGLHGTELWKSDGTEAGTVMVKDINTYGVAGSSSPADFITVGGTLYFTADDHESGRELWQSDATPEGTVLVKDIRPGWEGAWPSNLANAGGTLFFSATDGYSGRELWALVVDDTTPPISHIAYPPDGALVSGANLVVSGTASDFGSGVQKVEVSFDGGVTWQLASGAANWSYAWNLPADGSYTLQVRTTDNAGNVQAAPSSIGVTIDNTPPTAAISSPAAGSTFRGQNCSIKGTASDTGSGVQKVEVSVDGGSNWYPASGTVSWDYTWIPPADGNYLLRVRATDVAGNRQALPADVSMVVKQRDGDVNDDGKTDIGDALRVLRIAVGLVSPNASDLLHGDVAPYMNGRPEPDRALDIGDALIILRSAVGLIPL